MSVVHANIMMDYDHLSQFIGSAYFTPTVSRPFLSGSVFFSKGFLGCCGGM